MSRLPTRRIKDKKTTSGSSSIISGARKNVAGRLKYTQGNNTGSEEPFGETDRQKVRLLATDDIVPPSFSFDDLDDPQEQNYAPEIKPESNLIDEMGPEEIRRSLQQYVSELEETNWMFEADNKRSN